MDILNRHIWERKWLDLWTVVHFTTGMCFAFAIFFYGSPFIESLIVFTFFSIVWEVLEYYHQAKEPFSNQFTDVLSGIAGFLSVAHFVPKIALTLSEQIIYFTVVYVVAWGFACVGFISFAIHFQAKSLKEYKKGFRAAVFLYIVIVASTLILRSY